jgi:hypothetical protein
MNHTMILRRSFELVRRYRVLWILGILLALTAGGGGGNPTATLSNGGTTLAPTSEQVGVIVTLLCGFAILVFVLVILAIVVRYVVQAGLFRAVEQIEDVDRAPSFREAWRLGWNWRAFRLFLIDLVIGIPAVLAGFALFLLALSPLLLLLIDSTAVRVLAGILTAGLVLLAILVVIVAAVALSLLMEFFRRAAVLDDQGVFDAIRQGAVMVRRRFGDVAVMWALMFGIGLAYGFLVFLAVLVLSGVGLAIGGGLGWLIYQLTDLPLLAVLVGGPIAAIIIFVPLLLVGGLYEAFRSSTWTLTYREVRAPIA